MKILKVHNTGASDFTMFAIKFIMILLFVFYKSVLAGFFDKCDIPFTEKERNSLEGYYKNVREHCRKGYVANCDDSLSSDYIEVDPRPIGGIPDAYTGNPIYYQDYGLKREIVNIHTYDNGTKEIRTSISCGEFSKTLETKYDPNDNLIHSLLELKNGRDVSSRFEVWSKGRLVRIRYNNIDRSIIEKTPCYLKILEPKGESVIIKLDSKKEPATLMQKVIINSSEVYDVIKYHWYPHCKEYHEKHKAVDSLEDSISFYSDTEKETNISAKNEGNFLSRILLYKIIIIGIVVACIIIIRKKRKRRGK